jgi:hypothetical protein
MIDSRQALLVHPVSVKEALWALQSHLLLGSLVSYSLFLHALSMNLFLCMYAGVDESLYTGSITQLPLAPITGLSSPFWNIPLSGFRFNTNQNQTSSFQLQSDAYGQIYSSSPALIVPKSIADDMNKALGAVYNETLNLYTISCSAYDTAPKLIFEFGAGTDAEIPSQQYIYKLEDDTQSAYANQNVCYTAISGGGDDKNVFLGGPFFRSFYLTYEFTNKAVGIAESIAKIGKVYPHASAY